MRPHIALFYRYMLALAAIYLLINIALYTEAELKKNIPGVIIWFFLAAVAENIFKKYMK